MTRATRCACRTISMINWCVLWFLFVQLSTSNISCAENFDPSVSRPSSQSIVFPSFLSQPASEIYLNPLRGKWLFQVSFRPALCELEFIYQTSTNRKPPLTKQFQPVSSIDHVYVTMSRASRSTIGSLEKWMDIEVNGWVGLKNKLLFLRLGCGSAQSGRLFLNSTVLVLSNPFRIKSAEMESFPLTTTEGPQFLLDNTAFLIFSLPIIRPWPPQISIIKVSGGKEVVLIKFNPTNDGISSARSGNYRLVLDSTPLGGGATVIFFISSVVYKDVGKYKCLAVNHEFHRSQESAPIHLRVAEIGSSLSTSGVRLRWRSHGKQVEIFVGDSVEFSCVFETTSPQFVRVTWTLNGKPLVHNNTQMVYEFASLSISNASEENSGEYVCVPVISDLTFYDERESFILTVREVPRLRISPKVATLPMNGKTKINCKATPSIRKQTNNFRLRGVDEPKIEWYFNAKSLLVGMSSAPLPLTDPSSKSNLIYPTVDYFIQGNFIELGVRTEEPNGIHNNLRGLIGMFQCFARVLHNQKPKILSASSLLSMPKTKVTAVDYSDSDIGSESDGNPLFPQSSSIQFLIQLEVRTLELFWNTVNISWSLSPGAELLLGYPDQVLYALFFRFNQSDQPWRQFRSQPLQSPILLALEDLCAPLKLSSSGKQITFQIVAFVDLDVERLNNFNVTSPDVLSKAQFSSQPSPFPDANFQKLLGSSPIIHNYFPKQFVLETNSSLVIEWSMKDLNEFQLVNVTVLIFKSTKPVQQSLILLTETFELDRVEKYDQLSASASLFVTLDSVEKRIQHPLSANTTLQIAIHANVNKFYENAYDIFTSQLSKPISIEVVANPHRPPFAPLLTNLGSDSDARLVDPYWTKIIEQWINSNRLFFILLTVLSVVLITVILFSILCNLIRCMVMRKSLSNQKCKHDASKSDLIGRDSSKFGNLVVSPATAIECSSTSNSGSSSSSDNMRANRRQAPIDDYHNAYNLLIGGGQCQPLAPISINSCYNLIPNICSMMPSTQHGLATQFDCSTMGGAYSTLPFNKGNSPKDVGFEQYKATIGRVVNLPPPPASDLKPVNCLVPITDTEAGLEKSSVSTRVARRRTGNLPPVPKDSQRINLT